MTEITSLVIKLALNMYKTGNVMKSGKIDYGQFFLLDDEELKQLVINLNKLVTYRRYSKKALNELSSLPAAERAAYKDYLLELMSAQTSGRLPYSDLRKEDLESTQVLHLSFPRMS